MAKKVILKNNEDEQILPLTVTSQVLTENGSNTLLNELDNINNSIQNINDDLSNDVARINTNNHFISGQTIEGDLFVNGYININTKDFSSQNKSAMVIDSYKSSDGLTWYRMWSDGWMECGGYITTSGTSLTFTLPITFSNTNYTFTTSEWEATSSDTEGVDFGFLFSDKTVNTIRVSKASARCILYYACGY